MNTNKSLDSVWTVVANIVKERPYGPGGKEIRLGTKHFRPNAKVYIIDWYAGTCEKLIVVGQARKSGRFIKIVIKATWVENLRVKVCYHPQVMEIIREHYPNSRIERLNQDFAKNMYKVIPYWQQAMLKENTITSVSTSTRTTIFYKLWNWLNRR